MPNVSGILTYDIDEASLEATIDRIGDYKREVREEISDAVSETVDNIESEASANEDIDEVSVESHMLSRFKGQVFTRTNLNRPLGAYIEFGTGSYVFQGGGFNFSADLRKYASQFIVEGGEDIDTKAQPYLFPVVESERVAFRSKVREALGGGIRTRKQEGVTHFLVRNFTLS